MFLGNGIAFVVTLVLVNFFSVSIILDAYKFYRHGLDVMPKGNRVSVPMGLFFIATAMQWSNGFTFIVRDDPYCLLMSTVVTMICWIQIVAIIGYFFVLWRLGAYKKA